MMSRTNDPVPTIPDIAPLPLDLDLGSAADTTDQLTNLGLLLGSSAADDVFGSDVDTEADARAIGIDNPGMITTRGGEDTALGIAEALGTVSATAAGILNEGAILTGSKADRVEGIATASDAVGSPVEGLALAFGYSEIAVDPKSQSPSVLRTEGGDDEVIGTAAAAGADETGAFGLAFNDAETGGGADVVRGAATATGTGSTDARGVTVGLSDVDDDTLSPPLIAASIGSLDTGAGADELIGSAKVVVDAGAEDQLFFAGANALVVDGGAEAQWIDIVTANAQALADAAIAGRQALRDILPSLLAQIDTSTLDMGRGQDRIGATVALEANDLGFEVEPGDDLEVIADAIENAGALSLGGGADLVEIDLDIRSTIDGAKALGDPLDNASVGLITSYGVIATEVLRDLGLIDDSVSVEVETNTSAVFDLGEGSDRITTNTFATAVDDLSAGDGLGNRGLWIGGNGRETLDLTTVSVFVLGEVEEGDDEQREGIADGWESRSLVFLDDVDIGPNGEIREGATDRDGSDRVTADATAFGNGVLTIADGFEGREYTNSGGGNDRFDLTAAAFTTEVDRSDAAQVAILDQNVTAATGLQTEQFDEGDFLTRDGNDRVIGRATAAPALGLDPFAFDMADFDRGAFDAASDAFANRATIAQGISQVSADPDATNVGDDDTGRIDTGADAVTTDDDRLIGEAVALGVGDVQAYGILLTDAVTGVGADRLTGTAEAAGRNIAVANGIAVGLSNNTDNLGDTLRPDEAGTLAAGADADRLIASAIAETATDGLARAAAGLGDDQTVIGDANADSNGVLVDIGSLLDLGGGDNRVDAEATAKDVGIGGQNTAVTADGVENRGTVRAGDGADDISGSAEATSQGGVLLTIAGGLDNGFGSSRNDIEVAPVLETGGGDDVVSGRGTVSAQSGIGLASGIETSGTIDTGDGNDLLEGSAVAEVTGGIRAVADAIENADLVGGGAGGVIATGAGDDVLEATVRADGLAGADAEAIAVRNAFGEGEALTSAGLIDLGAGNDRIEAVARASSDTGAATAIGILGGTVLAGDGADTISAESSERLVGEAGVALAGGRGLGGDVRIDMGAGADALTGFGQASVSGGAGTDTLAFAFGLDAFREGGGQIVLGDAAANEVDFAFAGETLSTDGFETFVFDARTVGFQDLAGLLA